MCFHFCFCILQNLAIERPPPATVEPLEQIVNVNEMAIFRCWVPNLFSCDVHWYKEKVGGQLPYGVYQTDGILKIPHAQVEHSGNYICTASNDFGIGESPPVRLTVKPRKSVNQSVSNLFTINEWCRNFF